MPRKDALKKLRDVLVLRRKALRQALNGDLSLLNDLRDTKGDVVDFALDSAQDEINSQLAAVESREIARIDEALNHMDEGTYGLCAGCKSPIPLARLQALPYATCCIECKRKLEEFGYKSAQEADWAIILDTGMGDSDQALAT